MQKNCLEKMEKIYKKTIADLNKQLYNAYKRIKELTDELYCYKKKNKKDLTKE